MKSTSTLKISNPIYYDNLKVPYFTVARIINNKGLNLEWIGYDDPNSIEFKVKYAKAKKLGGVMIWSIDLDDFVGSSCGEMYPLSRIIYETTTGKNASEFLNKSPSAR